MNGPTGADGPTPADTRRVFVVSHTHWDREWYRTSHAFRVALVPVVRGVLHALEHEDGFEHFLLDGQTVLLEDYLSLCPEDEERIAALVRAGRLAIGPWYVLPDEFLISPESHVRNLLIGRDVAARFGEAQRVGYMPDAFGHIAQMPQILRRGGLDAFVYSRGDDDRIVESGQEYWWVGPDGSEVLAISQLGGYCRGGGLGHGERSPAGVSGPVDVDLAVQQVRTLLADLRAVSRTDVLLVSNGCDHLPAQDGVAAILDALRAAFPHTDFVHGSLADYVAAVRHAGGIDWKSRGELLGGKRELILPGVWSTRVYLKQRNDEAQSALSGYAEPLSCYHLFRFGRPYPAGTMRYAWKLLLQNHPHDSICGCSTDAVHREMMPRFAGVIEMAHAVIADQLRDLAPAIQRAAASGAPVVLAVMNTLPEARTEVVERTVVLRGDPGRDLSVTDERGHPVPCAVLEDQPARGVWSHDFETVLFGDRQDQLFRAHREALMSPGAPATPDDPLDRYVRIVFPAELPALGHANYVVSPSGPSDGALGTVTVAGDFMENDLVRVRLHADGTFDLDDKRSGVSYHGLNAFEDVEDVGDEYDHAAAPGGATISSRGIRGAVTIVESSPLRGVLEATLALAIPVGVTTDRTARASETASCPLTVRLTLTHGSPVVDVGVTFENRARDHRLRAVFPTQLESDEIVSEGHFQILRRPAAFPVGADWVQPPAGTYPQLGFSAVENGQVGLAVFNRGLHEVAPVRRAGALGFAVTLLRAVGWLSRDDLPPRRNRIAGPMMRTPDAQCLGTHHLRYAVMSYAGDCVSAGVPRWSARWRTPPLCVQGAHEGSVPGHRFSLVEQANPTVIVDAVKKHERRNTLVVRLHNVTDRAQVETLRCGLCVTEAWRTDLLEEREEQLASDAESVTIPLGPCEIVTVEVVLEPATP